ncbi:hypothetical protein CWS72_10045 [Telmatospirillum siberiense]|uniref:Sigma-54 factor interaction domain-containing protein n=2 Tax=Telmatospirillum siberiense TaxID=382514 RepID=A0A2N3PWC5_9PROT|nr:hypothetical protein CWS72_10045 [Telmatospirillum siberiense]
MRSLADRALAVAADLGIGLQVEMARDDGSALTALSLHPKTEVVVTRGGLVDCIRQIDTVSVVPISTSISQLLTLLQDLSARGIRKVGVVSRESLVDCDVGDFSIAKMEISIRSCTDEDSVKTTVAGLAGRGIEAIIGCRMSCAAAQTHEMMAVCLESDDFSIRVALLEAARIQDARDQEKLHGAQLKIIIDNIEEGVVALSDAGRAILLNEPARRLGFGMADEALISLLRGSSGEQTAMVNSRHILARCIPLDLDGRKYGEVITFLEATKIQDSEVKVRVSARQKGFYAKNRFEDIVGRSEVMRTLIEKAKRYAGYDANILIQGATGTGKEIFAQSIHNHSRYRNGPFVSVNTASIPPSLLESELFGYVDGAFTGARKGGKQGLFEMAHNGTIFLDEIGELTQDIQSRLLRVIQEKEIMRIGDNKIIPIDVRIICATNRNLFEDTQTGRFRQDLYYRIHVLGMHLPPLSSRTGDIPLLLNHYLRQLSPTGADTIRLTDEAWAMLERYDWPGNIRQIRNVAEVISYSGLSRIEVAHVAEILDEQGRAGDQNGLLTLEEGATLKEIEARVISAMMSRYSPEEACVRLGISRVTLWRKLNRMGAAPGKGPASH